MRTREELLTTAAVILSFAFVAAILLTRGPLP